MDGSLSCGGSLVVGLRCVFSRRTFSAMEALRIPVWMRGDSIVCYSLRPAKDIPANGRVERIRGETQSRSGICAASGRESYPGNDRFQTRPGARAERSEKQ